MRKAPRSGHTGTALAAVVVILQGCASQSPELPPHPLPTLPAQFAELEGSWVDVDPAAAPRGEWWKAFKDPVLDDLVNKASRDSTSIEFATAQLAQARALVRTARAAQSPQVSAGASIERQTTTPLFGSTAPATVFSSGVDASYELDLFGRLAKASRAAELDAAGRSALLGHAQLLVQSDTAQAYFALRALDEERELVVQTLGSYRETQALVEKRWRAGDVAEFDLDRIRTEVLSTEADLTALDGQRAQLDHGLAQIAGAVPTRSWLAPATWRGEPPRIPPGMPGSLLLRRPDVAAAYDAVLAARTRVGVARTAWFPDIALSGSAGFASTDAGDLLRWSARAWGIGAILSLPVIDGGRRQATVDNAVAQWNGAAAQYRDKVLGAVREVEDQLSTLRFLKDEAIARMGAVQSARRATVLLQSRYRHGDVSQLELLDARRTEFASRRLALHVRSASFRATVSLIQALGGGWHDEADSRRLPTK